MPVPNKIYLGDSVYAELELVLDRIKLTTNNGFGERDVIYLDRSVFFALVQYGTKAFKGEDDVSNTDTAGQG